MSTLITPEFRGSFVHLAEPHAIGDSDPAYSMAVAIPKSETEWLKKLDEEIKEVAIAKFGKIPPKLKLTLRDGDEEGRPEFVGCMVFNTKSKTRPGIVDSDLQPILDPELLYSGAWYRVSIQPFAWSHPSSGSGVSLGLQNVLWVKDGDDYSGRAAAATDFATV